MSISIHEYEITNRLKINLFTPCRVLGSKLILAAPSSTASGVRFFAPPGAGVNEEPTMRSEELDEVKINGFLCMISDTHKKTKK